MKDKVDSLLGFAQRSRSVSYGLEALKKSSAKMIILCPDAGERIVRGAKNAAKQNGIALIAAPAALDTILHTDNCRLVVVTDKQMANAITDIVRNNLSSYKLIDAEV